MAAANEPTDSLFSGQATVSYAGLDQTRSGADAAATDGSQPITNPTQATRDRYKLGEEIARGGMGVIYRATDTAFGREIAVKVLQQKFGGASGGSPVHRSRHGSPASSSIPPFLRPMISGYFPTADRSWP